MKRRAPVISTSMTKEKTTTGTSSSSSMKFTRTSFYDPPPPSSSSSSSHNRHTVKASTTSPVRLKSSSLSSSPSVVSSGSAVEEEDVDHKDGWNYLLLIALYTLQGIPMGLSASIPFLIQQKIRLLASTTTANIGSIPSSSSSSSTTVIDTVDAVHRMAVAAVASNLSQRTVSAASTVAATTARDSYNANAIFALCSWPFSLKLLWAPIVDSCYLKQRYGRRKSWIVPVQAVAGLLMIFGADFVERQLGLGHGHVLGGETINVKGVTAFFFVLYFLMATQDIAVDGWALTMLSKKNRGRGPICNSIGQNVGYFLSFVGFLALNDAESCELVWRPLLGLKSDPERGLVSLGYFIRSMGYFMLLITTVVAVFKRELVTKKSDSTNQVHGRLSFHRKKDNDDSDNDRELDAAEIGLAETYHRLWAVCKLPAVQWLFLILLTYRLPTSLGDNVKFLKAVEYGLSKSTTALLSPTIILPLGIIVPIVATRIWHNSPLQQFMNAYKLRVTLVPILDVLMLMALHRGKPNSLSGLMSYWSFIILSTALQAIVSSMQFNAQMTFFAKRVDPAIGGSYMTLLNTAANLGGTWPASLVMWLMGMLSKDPACVINIDTGIETCRAGRDPFFHLQVCFSILGMLWIFLLSKRVHIIESLPDDAWRTHVLDHSGGGSGTRTKKSKSSDEESLLSSVDVELVPNTRNSTHNRWR